MAPVKDKDEATAVAPEAAQPLFNHAITHHHSHYVCQGTDNGKGVHKAPNDSGTATVRAVLPRKASILSLLLLPFPGDWRHDGCLQGAQGEGGGSRSGG